MLTKSILILAMAAVVFGAGHETADHGEADHGEADHGEADHGEAEPTKAELETKFCGLFDAKKDSRQRRAAHAAGHCRGCAEKCSSRSRRAGHIACYQKCQDATNQMLADEKAKAADGSGITSTVSPTGTDSEAKGDHGEADTGEAKDDTTAAPKTQLKVEYTIAGMEGDLSTMTQAEKDGIKNKIKSEFEKAVAGSEVEVTLKQDSARRRRASHAATFSATVTVTLPAGTTLDAAKSAIKALPKLDLEYTVNGVKKTFAIDYAEVAKTVKDVTPSATTTPSEAATTPSSAATVLSTVATVLVATATTLF